MAGSSRMPGSMSRANARRYGKVALVLRRDGVAFSSVGASSLIVSPRFSDSAARAPLKVLKLVIRSFSCSSRLSSALKTLALALISFERSSGEVPSNASFTIAESRLASAPYWKESLIASAALSPWMSGSTPLSSAAVGWRLRAWPYPISSLERFSRSGACSVVRIWSSCTAVEVWVIGIVPPSSISGALGLPGLTSRKKLPSRKMRGRISTRVSSRSGWPPSSTEKVTSAASPTLRTLCTLPTLTPAMRTGESLRMLAAFSNTALTSYLSPKGSSLVTAR